MAIAALPDYLGRLELSTASPGLRFGMYLRLWGKNARTEEPLWTTHDINYRKAGKDHQERQFKDDNKRNALKQTIHLDPTHRAALQALAERQRALSGTITGADQLLIIDARSLAPFTTGLGNEHPLENGFAFLNPYGLPYLPGSGVKGVLRQAARELAGADSNATWDIESQWTEDAIDALFGTKDSTDTQRGALSFWDVIPQIKGDKLQIEVMTAHQSHYYQNGKSPHESGQPNPITFLTVSPGSTFTFHVVCNHPFLTRIAPELARDERWQALLREAFEHAFDWLGFGAKTAVGYGAMTLDESIAHERERAQAVREREKLPPEEQAIEALREIFTQEKEKGDLSANGQTACQRKELLYEALEWDNPTWRAKAADQIQATLKSLPWSKKAKKQGIAQQLDSLKQGK